MEAAIILAGIAFLCFVLITYANPYRGPLLTVAAEFLRPGKQFPALRSFRPFLLMALVVLSSPF